MKKIEAIIREEKLESVKTALEEKGIVGMTLIRVSGRGRQKGILLQWRAGDYRVDFLPKIKLEIVLSDDEYKDTVDIICKAARTGKEGDGMIFVLPVESVIRVGNSDNSEICVKTIEGGK